MFLIIVIVYFVVITGLCVALYRSFTSLWAKLFSVGVLLIVSSLFFIQRMVVDIVPLWFNKILYVVGTIWLIFVLYTVIISAILALGHLLRRLRNRTEKGNAKKGNLQMRRAVVLVFTLVLLVMVVGYRNATTPQIVRIGFDSEYIVKDDTLTFALVSDLHMGYAVGVGDMERLVDIVNAEEVDFLIIAGDLVDGDMKPVLADDIGAPLRKVNCPVYACMGNHEYIGSPNIAAEYIKGLGVTLLRDSVAYFDSVAIVGREDFSREHFGFNVRKSISDMIDSKGLSIVVDHQPTAIKECSQSGVSFYLSGHTHAGQVWPMRMFTKAIYGTDYGPYSFENTKGVITSGYGTWGPRVRIGSNSEVVIISVKSSR